MILFIHPYQRVLYLLHYVYYYIYYVKKATIVTSFQFIRPTEL